MGIIQHQLRYFTAILWLESRHLLLTNTPAQITLSSARVRKWIIHKLSSVYVGVQTDCSVQLLQLYENKIPRSVLNSIRSVYYLAILLDCVARIAQMRPIDTHVWRPWSLRVLVFVGHTDEICGNGWPNRDAVWRGRLVWAREPCIRRGVNIGTTWRIRLNDPCALAMRPDI